MEFRSGKPKVLMVMVLGASGSADGRLVERFFRRGRIYTSLEIPLAILLEPTVLFYGFDDWIPQYLPVDGDVEDGFHKDLKIDENTATSEIFTNAVVIIFAGFGRRRPLMYVELASRTLSDSVIALLSHYRVHSSRLISACPFLVWYPPLSLQRTVFAWV